MLLESEDSKKMKKARFTFWSTNFGPLEISDLLVPLPRSFPSH